MVDVGDGLAHHFVRDGSRIAFTQKQEAKDVGDGIAFFPLEVNMGRLSRGPFDVNEKRRDGVGNDRAAGAENAMIGNSLALDGELLGEF
jgi:hypothetical protein